MRLTIFGSTGPTGLLLIEQAIAAGYDVTAFARTPSKLPTHDRLRVVEGVLSDAEAINEAVRGSDAVLSLLGPSTRPAESPQLVPGYQRIIDAMRAHGVERLIVMGTATMPDPADGRNLKLSSIIRVLRLVQRPTYDAIRGIGTLVRESGLAWTIVRLPFLTDGPQSTSVNAGPVGKRESLKLSRADVAAYFLAQVTDVSQLRKAPFVTER